MNKAVYIVHGWDGYPTEGWFPWLKQELEQRNFNVIVPQLPKPEEPRIQAWVPALAAAVTNPNENTYFVGHSMGCQTIARYIQSLPNGTEIGGAVFVAGFFKRLTNLENDDVVRSVVNEWLSTSLDLSAVAAAVPRSVAIFSDDDTYVPLENKDEFENILHSQIIIEHGKGHFSGSTGTTELPSALQAILNITKDYKAGG